MQEPRSTSTLELVLSEQQLQNMSQIDLSRTGDSNQNEHRQQQTQSGQLFSFQKLKKWPTRFRENFKAKMDEAKSSSETKTEFVLQLMHSFSGIVIWILCFICTTIVPVILFFIGLANLDDCHDRPSLPYLIFATGFVMTASNLFNLALALDLPILTNHQILTNETKNIIASIINMIFNCVAAFFYLLCGYMVFNISNGSSQKPVTNDSIEVDCNTLLYYFTLWFVTLTLSLIAVLSLLASVFFVYHKYRLAIISGSTPRSQSDTNTNQSNNYTTNRV